MRVPGKNNTFVHVEPQIHFFCRISTSVDDTGQTHLESQHSKNYTAVLSGKDKSYLLPN